MIAFDWLTGVVVPLGASLIGGLIAGVASYVSAKKAAAYQVSHAQELARMMLGLEREGEIIKQLDDATALLFRQLEDVMPSIPNIGAKKQLPSEWDTIILAAWNEFHTVVSSIWLRIPQRVRADVVEVLSGWDARIEWTKLVAEEQGSIDPVLNLIKEFHSETVNLMQQLGLALGV